MASKENLPEAAPRNPHGDFKSVEASRPDFDTTAAFHYTKTPAPAWQYGEGANTPSAASHVAIDPHAPGRPAGFNYKFLISAITPRPIAFLSTVSKDGSENLAPFSYFNMINHDPPLFTVGFASGLASPKDSLRNLVESEKVVINIISEPFLEAANATSINAPHGVSEWVVSGLTPVRDTENGVARVKEAIVSIEGRLDFTKEWESRSTPGKKSGTLAVIEGTKFWVREDAVNEERSMVDADVLRSVGRLGGITYSRTVEGIELTRPDFDKTLGQEGYEKLKKEGKGQ
ncbi:hypothetical protein ACHAQH_007555 [Verticillium albo-atrum]